MSSGSGISENVRAAVIQVCREAFYYRDDVKAIFIEAGCPEDLYERYNDPSNSKAKIARFVLNDLRKMGSRGAIIERRLVAELCRMDRPRPDAPNPRLGKDALAELKKEAKKGSLLVDPEQAEVANRQARAKHAQQAQIRRQEKLGALRGQFYDLLRDRPRTPAEIQQRGYALEAILADLFELYDFQYRRPYRADHEQVDGSFHFRGFTYIVEAKWQATSPSFGDLVKFKAMVDGKLESTRGLFVAMSQYDEDAIEHLRLASVARNNLVLVDRDDIITIFDGRVSLTDALIAKVDAAEQEGRPWYPIGR